MLQPTNKRLRSPQGPAPTASLEAVAHDFAVRLCRDFPAEISRDPKAFKKSVLRLIRRGLPPRRGRPNDPHVDDAVRMVEQGKSFTEVLRMQIRNFDKLDTYGRYLAGKGLRTAIARRRRSAASVGNSNTSANRKDFIK